MSDISPGGLLLQPPGSLLQPPGLAPPLLRLPGESVGPLSELAPGVSLNMEYLRSYLG